MPIEPAEHRERVRDILDLDQIRAGIERVEDGARVEIDLGNRAGFPAVSAH